MTEPRFPSTGLSDPELEVALLDLGQHLAYPVTPDITRRVRRRLDARHRPPPIQSPIRSLSSRRLWLAAAGLLTAILAGLLLFPEARGAIAERLGLPGVIIRWVEEAPPRPSPVAARLMLGTQLTLEEAQVAVDFPIQLPSADGFGLPSEVYLLGLGEDAMVSLVYAAGPKLPASDTIGVGALLTQFQGKTDRGLIEKGLAEKTVDPETIIEYASVNGERGYWITGAPHGFFLICNDGDECREERYRLAGNVLL